MIAAGPAAALAATVKVTTTICRVPAANVCPEDKASATPKRPLPACAALVLSMAPAAPLPSAAVGLLSAAAGKFTLKPMAFSLPSETSSMATLTV